MSNVISKRIARNISYKLTEKLKEQVEITKANFDKEVIRIYKDLVPKEVMQFQKQFPKFIKTTSYINVVITISPKKTEWVELSDGDEVIDSSNSSSFTAELHLNSKNCKSAKILWKLHVKAKEMYNITRQRTELCLLSLRSYKRIIAEMPMAIPFLPDQEAKQEAVIATKKDNFKSLKKQLKVLNNG